METDQVAFLAGVGLVLYLLWRKGVLVRGGAAPGPGVIGTPIRILGADGAAADVNAVDYQYQGTPISGAACA